MVFIFVCIPIVYSLYVIRKNMELGLKPNYGNYFATFMFYVLTAGLLNLLAFSIKPTTIGEISFATVVDVLFTFALFRSNKYLFTPITKTSENEADRSIANKATEIDHTLKDIPQEDSVD